jgi:hypothetical protein
MQLTEKAPNTPTGFDRRSGWHPGSGSCRPSEKFNKPGE